ncbi:MAG: glutamine amidotransferase-related protein [Candidatus Nanoarchaeia archaeon]
MILLISTCYEKMHELEFVRPIEDILKLNGIEYFVKNYKEINKKDLESADKIIICGTSLKDNDFLNNLKNFEWVRDFEKPLLGICSGMQIIGIIFGGKIKNKTEIGFYFEEFNKYFLGLNGRQEVYHLHNNYIDFSKLNDFEVYCKGNEIIQALKHKQREIYAILFHPEIRNKDLITNFVSF